MLVDLNQKKSQNFFKDIKFHYDYIIIGTGPAGTVILDNLKKKNIKKILVIERGNFYEKKYENEYHDNIVGSVFARWLCATWCDRHYNSQ